MTIRDRFLAITAFFGIASGASCSVPTHPSASPYLPGFTDFELPDANTLHVVANNNAHLTPEESSRECHILDNFSVKSNSRREGDGYHLHTEGRALFQHKDGSLYYIDFAPLHGKEVLAAALQDGPLPCKIVLTDMDNPDHASDEYSNQHLIQTLNKNIHRSGNFYNFSFVTYLSPQVVRTILGRVVNFGESPQILSQRDYPKLKKAFPWIPNETASLNAIEHIARQNTVVVGAGNRSFHSGELFAMIPHVVSAEAYFDQETKRKAIFSGRGTATEEGSTYGSVVSSSDEAYRLKLDGTELYYPILEQKAPPRVETVIRHYLNRTADTSTIASYDEFRRFFLFKLKLAAKMVAAHPKAKPHALSHSYNLQLEAYSKAHHHVADKLVRVTDIVRVDRETAREQSTLLSDDVKNVAELNRADLGCYSHRIEHKLARARDVLTSLINHYSSFNFVIDPKNGKIDLDRNDLYIHYGTSYASPRVMADMVKEAEHKASGSWQKRVIDASREVHAGNIRL